MSKSNLDFVTAPPLVGIPKSVDQETEAQVASKMPKPVGWQILLAMPSVEEKTEGGIIKADMTKEIEQTSSVVGYVLAMGDECYNDPERFKEPWCKEGDFVLIGAYQGTRFKVNGTELRLINDDTVKAIVQDPRGYSRI